MEKKSFRESNGKLKVGETKNGQKRLEGFLQVDGKSYFCDVYKKSEDTLKKYPSEWLYTIYVKEQTQINNKPKPPVVSQSEQKRVETIKKSFEQPAARDESEDIPF